VVRGWLRYGALRVHGTANKSCQVGGLGFTSEGCTVCAWDCLKEVQGGSVRG
jgi:hypothetical protein